MLRVKPVLSRGREMTEKRKLTLSRDVHLVSNSDRLAVVVLLPVSLSQTWVDFVIEVRHEKAR